jgi:hypothetical protein
VSLSDLIQVLSLLFLAGALLLSARQGRQMIRQSAAMAGELFNDVSTSLMQAHTDQRTTIFLDDPELLAWHLASRGYRSTTSLENKQRLYALVKFDTLESIHLRHVRGTVDDAIWSGWLQVLRVDLRVPVFAEVWENGQQFYEQSFARMVDSLLEEQKSTLVGSGQTHE